MRVFRGGVELTIGATLDELPGTEARTGGSSSAAESALSGVSVSDLTAESAQQLGVPGTAGVVVTDISPSSPAADSGLRRTSKDEPLLLVNHQGHTLYVVA